MSVLVGSIVLLLVVYQINKKRGGIVQKFSGDLTKKQKLLLQENVLYFKNLTELEKDKLEQEKEYYKNEIAKDKKEIEKEHCLPMDFTGRPMRGYIFVTPDGFDTEDDLAYYIDLCMTFNPLAKASKPRNRK